MSAVEQPLLTVAEFERIPDPPDGSRLELDEADTLDGGDILPGFSCKVADLFQ
jgi:hypothetical protein